MDVRGTAEFVGPVLDEVGPRDLVGRLDDESLDTDIRSETEEALALTGRDVGTPIIHYEPPHGVPSSAP